MGGFFFWSSCKRGRNKWEIVGLSCNEERGWGVPLGGDICLRLSGVQISRKTRLMSILEIYG